MKSLLVALSSLMIFAPALKAGPGPAIPLWPVRAPGETNGAPAEVTLGEVRVVAGKPITRISQVSQPTITIYQAPEAQKNGAAVVVCPGGGYSFLAWDLEGTEVCDWLNAIGVTGVLLKYRVPKGDQPPLQDAQRAMGLLRERAPEFGIDPHRIGILGFSAGGFLAANLSANCRRRAYPAVDDADAQSCRPDFQLLLYPGKLVAKSGEKESPDAVVTSNTPPTFMVMAMNDPIGVSNALVYATALQKAHVPAEVHLYATGGHGFGLRPTEAPITAWPELAAKWMESRGLLRGSAGVTNSR